jgi:hypothetical protein
MVQPPAGSKTSGHGTSVFSKDGAIGKQFTAEQGGIGGAAQKVGGPLDKDGVIGGLLLLRYCEMHVFFVFLD